MNKTTLATFTLLITILAAVITIGITPDAFAAEPNKNFFNGHYYQYFADAGITWSDAKAAAESKMFNGISGHLATITNGREEFSVGDAIIPANASAWIGLSDKDTEGQYKWVTGELFDYTNWNTGQPSAGTGDEDYVEIAPLGNHVYKWNNVVNNSTDIDGYVVEYLPPNSDPVLNPANGHYYQYIHTNTISWTDAQAAAESHTFNGIQGHLVTITSESENNFVFNFMPNTIVTWIGLTDEDTEGQYKWVTGEPFEHSDWGASTTYVDTSKHYVSIEKHDSITWKNNENNVRLASAYIVEYDPPTLNPTNRHYYEFIYNSDITWEEAKEAAENSTYKDVSGHLATITTASENTFVANLVPDASHAWMGLTDETTEGTYKWVTDEPYSYSNWAPHQPDNSGGNEHYVEFLGSNNKWNDVPKNYNNITGYIVEYDSPTINSANGHYYEYISDPGITWTEAKTAAENSTYKGVSGHLVTPTTASENEFVGDLVPDDSHSWIGYSDKDSEGTYKWITGEPFSYRNWDSGQPSAGSYDEDYVEFRGSNSKWTNSINNNTNITGYVVEYDFPVLNPENGHYYEYFLNENISWAAAKTAAENSRLNGISGHLVTITSASENQFVKDSLPNNSGAWIGLTDETTEGTYKWVTDEPYSYSNWAPHQPDNHFDQDYVEFFGSNGKWNDGDMYTNTSRGYVVEYDSPFLNSENGHYYQYVSDDDITWEEAQTAAKNSTYNGISGQLVTITTANENTFVSGLVPDSSRTWIGLTDETTEGTYKWVTGELYGTYTNWGSTVTLASRDYGFLVSNGKWYDAVNHDTNITGYIIEYDFPILNTQNRHYYQYVIDDDITWTDAKAAAENSTYNGVSGYLVTITSASENEFVDNLVSDDSRVWMGLSDTVTKWAYAWVTGESFIYTNWEQGQPVNPNGNEDYVEFIASNGKWNNIINDNTAINGYVIEYGSNPVPNTQNRHYYQYVIDDDITWTDAKAAAENSTYNGVSGYLVTITSASENEFVDNLVPDDSRDRAWIGLSDTVTEETFKWVTDEPLIYTNWYPGEPNMSNNEDYIEFLGWNGQWNNMANDNIAINGYVIEYTLPTVDPVLNPANGHYYEYVTSPGISWTDAKATAENSTFNGTSGHLVTITSQSENDFVAELHPSDFRPWIGLTDETTEGTYKWVTDEPYSYSNWSPGQPDNHNDNENYVQFLGYNDKWNDLPNDYNIITGYIIEYTPPPVKNPVNGHYYEYVIDDDITWTEAKTAAENSTYNGTSGHLVTITSTSENNFVSELVPDNYDFTWIGLSDEDTEGEYKWVTGETSLYTNWDVNQPDNYNGNEDYVQFRGYSDRWNDIKNDPDYVNGYIIEYDIPHLNPENSHYYEFVTDYNISWTDAKAAAENSTFNGTSGHLVTIANESENIFISNIIPPGGYSWIGLTDQVTEGEFKWVTGEPLNYTNWPIGGASTDPGQDYVKYDAFTKKWSVNLNEILDLDGYIIEYDTPNT